ESAFSLSGRFIVRIATRSSTANWRSCVSVAMHPPVWHVHAYHFTVPRPIQREGRRRGSEGGWQKSLAKCHCSQAPPMLASRAERSQPIRIAILLYDGMTALDAIGPYDVLRQLPGAEVVFVGDTAGVKHTEQQPLGLVADRGLGEVPKADILVVPGGFGQERVMRETRTLDWIRSIHATTEWTTSVCTGSLILGAAGLLRGLRATT